MTHPPRDWLVGFRAAGYKPKFSEPHTVKLPKDVGEDGSRAACESRLAHVGTAPSAALARKTRPVRLGRWCPHGPWFRLREER